MNISDVKENNRKAMVNCKSESSISEEIISVLNKVFQII
jgi:hypothetical protein